MSKTAAIKTTDVAKVREAKRAFFMNLFDLSWRLAGAMLAPIFIGLYIDSIRDNGQGFALAGFLVGMICGVLVMRSVVRNLAKGSDG